MGTIIFPFSKSFCAARGNLPFSWNGVISHRPTTRHEISQIRVKSTSFCLDLRFRRIYAVLGLATCWNFCSKLVHSPPGLVGIAQKQIRRHCGSSGTDFWEIGRNRYRFVCKNTARKNRYRFLQKKSVPIWEWSETDFCDCKQNGSSHKTSLTILSREGAS